MATTVDELSTFALDEPAFRQRIPFRLETTNLRGAFVSPAPPENFDPNKASPSELVRHGLMWRRPTAKDDPELVKAWQKIFSRKWLAKDRIVPKLEPQVGKTHFLRKEPRRAADQSFLSGMWAGSGFRNGSWNGIIGTWKIPTVSKPSEPQGTEGGWNSSSWVGIDGFFVSNDVLQCGIQQRVNANGQASYVAWYEWWAPPQPNSPGYVWQTNIANFPVSPGQEVYGAVQYINNNTAGHVYFANNTTGQHFTITLAPPPGASFAGNSVEWIMEAPDGGEPISSLPKFTAVAFTSAIACGANNAIGNPQNGDITNIENTSNKVLTSVAVGNYTTTITFIG
jgi:hypothetical protein